ncbi:MAG: glutamine synthetase [Rhodospirillaceae bacterium]|nr:glutamine synthetase [Rhodospirillaceae bacterium]MBT5667535.1 glutamine synthetase [Rhodospirillaceae bacterium]MBT5809976.1 glutamine synthetase [Rhodospirillaceae bacterium]
MAGNLDIDALTALVESGEIDTVLVCFPDMQGRLVGKRVTGRFFLDHGVHELHVCDYLLTVDMDMEPVPGYAAANWDTGYGDFAVRPDMTTLRRIPWLEATALVLGDCIGADDAEVPHSPRAILKRQIARADALGYTIMIGSELEFYIFDDSFEDAAEKRYADLKTTGRYIEDYHIFQTTKEEGMIRAIRNGMDGAAVPVEFSKGEWGPGQAEINLRFADALEMADRHVIYKNGAKEIAWAAGKAITFMAKWREDLAGNSCHIHSSLWRGGEPVFAADDAPEFNQWAAGQMALADDMTFFLAPYINSYKRFQAGSFAPTRAAWSLDNRTAGFRVVGKGGARRLECRIPGGDCNPYLAFAATIAAGLHGIENQLDPVPMMHGNMYEAPDAPEIPKTLRAALTALDDSAPLRAAFGDAVIEHYLHTGWWEQAEYDRRVTDWELRRLFERG